MISAKLKNIIWSLVILHLAIGVAPAWGQNVWQLKDGRQGIDLGKMVVEDQAFFLLIDGREEVVPFAALSHPVDNIDMMSKIRSGDLRLKCVGDQPPRWFFVSAEAIKYSFDVKDDQDTEPVNRIVSKIGSRNVYFVEGTKGSAYFVEEVDIDRTKQASRPCPHVMYADDLDDRHVYFSHIAVGARDGYTSAICCSFENQETRQ